MKKKTAIKILVLLIIVIIVVLTYFFFFQNNDKKSGEVILPEQPNSNFFPGSENFDPESENQQTPDNQQNNKFQNIPSLRQISENPTSGFVIFDEISSTTNSLTTNEDEPINETETVYRFVNRSNGNLFQTNSKTTSIKRITNNTIPKVYDAVFSQNGNNVIFRYLDKLNKIETNFATLIDNNNSTSTIIGDEGNFLEIESNVLPKNIENINIHSNDLVFYTLNNNGLSGYLFDLNKSTSQNLAFSSQLSQVTTKWFKDNTILIGTKPSNNSGGLLYEYNLDTNQNTKILESNLGFNYLPKENSNNIVYSQLFGDTINSYSYNTETKERIDLKLNTIVSDKCAWSNITDTIIYCAVPNIQIGFGYPNVWYQGQASFNDSLYMVDTATGLKFEVSGLDGDFDIIKPQISENDEYFVFINKKDLTLWSLDLVN